MRATMTHTRHGIEMVTASALRTREWSQPYPLQDHVPCMILREIARYAYAVDE
jgi:uncharacterized protein YbaR (Trm112 family)